MEALVKFLAVVVVPLMLLNMLGGIVAGVWLGVLGQWGIIGYGIAALVLSSYGLGMALMPGLLFDAPGLAFHQKGSKLGFYVLAFLSQLYTIAVLTIWCMGVLYFFVRQANTSSIIPTLLWSYAVATGPIVFLAQKDVQSDRGSYSGISTLFVQVAYVICIFAVFLFSVPLIEVAVLFGAFLFVGQVSVFWMSQIEAASRRS